MKRRILLVRVLVLPVLALALCSRHVYAEDSLPETLLASAGLLLLIAAMSGRIWASAFITGRKDRELVTVGPYALVRNPLYLFSLLGFIGAGLAFASVTLAAALAAVFFVSHWPAILAEEERLRALFGDDYDRYRDRVPRLLPAGAWSRAFRRRRHDDAPLVLDPRRFRTAVLDCLLIPLVFIVADLLEWGQVSGVIPVLFHIP